MKYLASDIVSGNERFDIGTILKAKAGSFKILVKEAIIRIQSCI